MCLTLNKKRFEAGMPDLHYQTFGQRVLVAGGSATDTTYGSFLYSLKRLSAQNAPAYSGE